MSTNGTPPLSAPEIERALLCRLLVTADADVQAEVMGTLEARDFADERHATLYTAAMDLHGQGAPLEFEAVMEHLRAQSALQLAGGVPYVASLLDATPTMQPEYHVSLLQGYSLRRKLRAALVKGIGLTEAMDRDLDEVAHEVERLVLSAGERKGEADTLREMGSYLAAFVETMETTEQGLTWGLEDLDGLTRGLRRQKLYTIMARPSMGKAQPLWEKVLTPSGWRQMGTLGIGDTVTGADGKPCRILAVHPQGFKEVFRITFGDGGYVYACGEHLWSTTDRNERRRRANPTPKSTLEVANTIYRTDGHAGANHCIPVVGPVEFSPPEGERPLDAYWLGLWLGDGDCGNGVRLTNPEPDLQEEFVQRLPLADTATLAGICLRVRGRGTKGSATTRALRSLGLAALCSFEKFVPRSYLMAAPDVRLDLLRGLLDTDGYVHPSGVAVEWCSASDRLADDVEFLVGSLGGWVTRTHGPAHYTVAGVRHPARDRNRLNIFLPPSVCPVASVKHLAKWKARRRRLSGRPIRAVEPAGMHPCQCITVEGGHYVTSCFAVTHNSAMVQGVALNAAINEGKRVAFFSVENGEEEWMEAAFAWAGGFDMHTFRLILSSARPDLAQGAVEFAKALEALRDARSRLFLDTQSRTVAQMLRRARRLKRSGGLDLIVSDHIHEMDGEGENEERKVAKIARDKKAAAKELDVPWLTAAQLNRKCEDRADKRPLPSDGRASGGIEEASDVIGLLYRPEYYFGPMMEVGKGKTADKINVHGYAEWIIGKNRGGPRQFREKDHVKLYFRAEAVRFESFARWKP